MSLPVLLCANIAAALFSLRASAGCNITKLINGNIIYCFCIPTSVTRSIFNLLLILSDFPVLAAISFCKRDFFSNNTGSQARISLGFGSTGN